MGDTKKKLVYDREPERIRTFQVNSATPFNAEPPGKVLAKEFFTPNEHFFVRNHGPVPEIDSEKYRLSIEGLVENQLSLSLKDLQKRFERVTVVATLQCAGNRRNELSVVKKVKGVGWGTNAVSNASWGGVRLRDVLQAAGVKPNAQHVAFESLEETVEDRVYGSSIPLDKAMDEIGDVLLAFEMNGVELPRDHGYPLRVVVPGHIGARSVKWLARIILQTDESKSFFQARDYKLFVPQVDAPVPAELWDRAPSMQEYPVQSAILEPSDGELVGERGFTLKGYALSGGGRMIERVDVSLDGGKTWQLAELNRGSVEKSSRLRQHRNRNWSWTLWTLQVREDDIQRNRTSNPPDSLRIVCRAWDSSSNTQPEKPDSIWNFRGLSCNCWNAITLRTKPASKL